jgi:anti-anti-sigma factor
VTGADLPLSDFSIGASFVDGQVVLALRGEVDALTAPEFGAFFETMIDRGHRTVMLDLVGLRFMDASGLAVIALGADRLEVLGGTLTIRTPAALIRQMLDITGFARLVVLGERESDYGEFDPGRPRTVAAVMADSAAPVTGMVGGPPTDSSRLTQSVRQFTAIHSGDEMIDGALRLAVTLAHAVVGAADGVSVSLRRRGQLSTVAATDQTISAMDATQYETGEGPCVDASTDGHWFLTESLDEEARWPAFTPRARDLGIRAILSSPLLVQNRPVGALNIYSRRPQAFTLRDQELAATFASETALLLNEAETDMSDDHLSIRFLGALRAREVIAQAQGVLMEREGLAEHDAYSEMRRYSRQNGRPLQERAEHIVMSTRRPNPFWPDSPRG